MKSNEKNQTFLEEMLQFLRLFPVTTLKIYPKSFISTNGLTYGLFRTTEGKKLAVIGEKAPVLKSPLKGKCYHQTLTLKVCDLSLENTECLMSLFPYTKPISLKKYPVTIGTGDRLGVATPGHIRAIRKYQMRPVLAQQSVRENIQTGRDFQQVVQDAAWAVFQENYQEGYGADGDHLKSLDQIKKALDAGVSMITLDLSEKLNPEAMHQPREMIERQFHEKIEREDSKVLFHIFLDKEFHYRGPHGAFSIQFDSESIKRNHLLFHKAIDFTEEVYEWLHSLFGYRNPIDFEISIDETPFPTSPESHLFFIISLNHRGIQIDSLAPRFIGEFQKGIDYRGDIKRFREQFYQHALIARHYGNYKISIHSGSDKFSVFRHMGALADEGLHLKTSGTSWLEAVRLIALNNPSLYREIHRFALTKFEESSKYYHVTTDLEQIPSVEELQDQKLGDLLEQDDARQLLHLTYGFLLNAKDNEGRTLFRDRIYRALTDDEENYWSLLEKHIAKHLDFLGVKKRECESAT